MLFPETLNICVLPPRISYFRIKCPCLTFVSPALLDENPLRSIIWYIYRNWTEMLVSEVKVDSTDRSLISKEVFQYVFL